MRDLKLTLVDMITHKMEINSYTFHMRVEDRIGADVSCAHPHCHSKQSVEQEVMYATHIRAVEPKITQQQWQQLLNIRPL